MISGYAKSDDVESATILFSQMPSRDFITWTTMITCYSQNKQFKEAIDVFKEMIETPGVSPDEVIMFSVLSVCAHLGSLEMGRKTHNYLMQNRFDINVYIGSALVDIDFSLRIRSVDGFQGSEENVIIISTIRSNWNGSVGFLSNSQQTNVALTSARYCLWILGNEQTLINSGSVWKKLVIDRKDRGCFFDANDDEGLSKAKINSVINLMICLMGIYFSKVTFGDGFKKSLERIKVHIRRKVVDLMMKLSNGWCYPQKCKNLNTGDGVLKQYKIHGVFMLFWTVDILKEGYVGLLRKSLVEVSRLNSMY
ncbi:hypothetical protein GIB67_035198 [Kingdonia uniflora]|uniref:DNA2/NAM7 helicase-like C-terminal domain-containing protein n=1 Tax=Kingdonia uniflora TaxID=39325 RepID=A0A7J7LDL2_9MAGN|nr:hypothetical protein GIB67_035198 [Kingdonia uniflora]